MKITSLEIIFWFWSAGFMLDEVVGFNEQGFNLYIMSIWNAFDLGMQISSPGGAPKRDLTSFRYSISAYMLLCAPTV